MLKQFAGNTTGMLIRALAHVLMAILLHASIPSSAEFFWRDLLVASNKVWGPADDPAHRSVFVQVDQTFLDPDVALAMQFKQWGELLEQIHRAQPAVILVDYQFSPRRFESLLPGQADRFEQLLVELSKTGGLILGLEPQPGNPQAGGFTLREVEQNKTFTNACMALSLDDDQVLRDSQKYPSEWCPQQAPRAMAAAAAEYLGAVVREDGLILTRGQASVVKIAGSDILNNPLPEKQLEGAIVVVGSNFPYQDELMAIHQADGLLSHERMKGGLVHALNTEALLENRIAWNSQVYWARLLIPLALLLLILPGKSSAPVIALWLMGLGLLVTEMVTVNIHRIYIDAITPALFCLVTALVLTGSRILDALLLKRKIQSLLGGLLSPAVFKQCMDSPELFMQTRRFEKASVLVLDLQGYSQDANQLPLDALYDNTNALLAACTGIIHQHGGCVERFRGDGLLAYFGAPLPANNSLDDALQAARDILNLLEREGNPVLSQFHQRIRMGISSGEVILGRVGNPQRFDLAVTGLAANRAAHFEMLADPVHYPVVLDQVSLSITSKTWRQKTLPQRHPKHPDLELIGLLLGNI